jgi:hypothetical protein
MEKIVVDIWGGKNSGDHVARFLLPMEEALVVTQVELTKGYLINLRLETDLAWGDDLNFDKRLKLN